MGYPGILVDDAGFGQKAKRECAVMKGTAPLSKTYRTCHKPEVGLILLSNRFENLPKSSGHGNGIAVFFARCFFTVSHNTATHRRIPLEFLENLSTEALPLQSPAECLPILSYRC